MNTRYRTIRSLSIAALLGLAIAATSANADPWWSNGQNSIAIGNGHPNVDGSLVDVQIRVGGSTAPLYFKPGTDDRHYFQAFRGRNYSLVLHNNTGSRVGVLIAVDGLNVVNGVHSTLDRHEPMYVLGPWETTEIKGWRSSLNDVRRFVFVDEQRSYAERTGQANGDMGWVRVMTYREVVPQAWRGDDRPRRFQGDDNEDERALDGTRGQAVPAPQAGMKSSKPLGEERQGFTQNQAPQAAPGTGWGERRYDPVQETNFEPQRWATDQIILRYEYESGLRALGIFPRRARVFERDRGELGFAQPPRW